MTRPTATLSLDLDNLWSYQKTHGDPGWDKFPSYLDLVVPRMLDLLAERSLEITVFVVGQDAALAGNRDALGRIAAAGHEIGNHSFHHEPWLHRYTRAAVEDEIARAEETIHDATGVRPDGFRGPGYSLSEDVLRVLHRRGYRYDASTFPTFLGPLARAHYFMHARLSSDQQTERQALFGGVRDGLRPVGPYRWQLDEGELLEIPVTTMPGLKLPFHVSYLHWIAGFSEPLARAHFGVALRMCDLAGVAPSILLHPLDLLGGEDVPALRFFPGMDQPAAPKLDRVRRVLAVLADRYQVQPMGVHAAGLADRSLPVRRPRFTFQTPDPAPLFAAGERGPSQ